ncbi:Hpt domain-containing protein [Sphingorhabdus lutea]|uniref:Hpt domain-containing protein n=1 Tax=Sphingorhabdus lutea TaxID=1913578 RepID=A0A1L3JBT5_9SPHN|nr:Hpt domain-containing protein [Sphingorhabdus lutea]APG62605.1 Hpt domain-containing protein [Sphingorhabdus lutea]
MSVAFGNFENSLKAASGDDAKLFAELRQAFVDSANRQLDLMTRSRCDANWHHSALRLHGIAASFGAISVMELADEASQGAPGDPVILRKLNAAITEILS